MTRKLALSNSFKLPIDAVTQRISILGRTGSGKSHTAGVLAEEALKVGQQVVIADPKGDWWGLRSSADGKSAGLPITIMGGEHGDLPLEPTAGALVADIVINEGISVILDFSLFESKAQEIRFMEAFADRLYRKNKRPLLFIVDEADIFAPQRPEKNETVMLNRMETLCRRGRSKGIGIVLISQRSASLHKGCLSQTELMIVHQTTAPQDKKAIEYWVVDHGDDEQRREFMARIPKLPIGTAIAWSPSWLQIYVEERIREKQTYDSSATPKVGEHRRAPRVLAQVDLERLKAHMAETIEKAKQEDPKLLRAEISRLKAELSAKPKAAAPAQASSVAPREVIKNRLVEVPALGKRPVNAIRKASDRALQVCTLLNDMTAKLIEARAGFEGGAGKISEVLERFLKMPQTSISAPYIASPRLRVEPPPPRAAKAPIAPVRRQASAPTNGEHDGALSKCHRAILTVLAQYPEGCPIGKISLLAGYKKSGTFMSTLSNLRTSGFMIGDNSGIMKITAQGLEALGDFDPLPVGRDLANYWINHPSFDKCERNILEKLVENPDGLTIGEISEATGYSQSGTFMSSLSTLRTSGVMVGKNSEKMRVSENLL